MNLGIDPRHADQMVRGLISLPNGTGKTLRIGVFARGAKAEEALAAGADVVGAEDLAEKVQAGEIEFDRCIATPDMMALVGRLGKILGPARPDAEPAPRHRHDGRQGRGLRRQGRPGRVPRREGRHHPCRHRQGQLRRRKSCWRTPAPSPTPSARPSRPAPRAPTSRGSRSAPPWAPACKVDTVDARRLTEYAGAFRGRRAGGREPSEPVRDCTWFPLLNRGRTLMGRTDRARAQETGKPEFAAAFGPREFGGSD